ncbi:MAG: hypothetical protein PHX18_05210 [Candidatus Gastranaerophilales bacterium]|nr:hypothetical protein [Candidatus Gastranaerophilales bacterium]
MEPNNQARLPEGVGKKIVEALKKDEIEITPVASDETFEEKEEAPSLSAFNFSQELQEPKEPAFHEYKYETSEAEDLELPENVMVLKKLISQLPQGVNRQIGAQIIRQTMEAMGISMKTVLSEAQYIQEDLGNSIRDCANSIEEYKTNIKALEHKIQLHKRQAAQLGELINLFILTGKK